MIGPPVISFYSPLEGIGIVSFIIVNSHDITDDNLTFIINIDFESLVTPTPRLHHHDGWGSIHRRSLIRGYKSACIQVFHRNRTHAFHMQPPRAKAPSIVNLHIFMDTCNLTNSFSPASQFIIADHSVGVHVTSDVSHIGFIKYSPYS